MAAADRCESCKRKLKERKGELVCTNKKCDQFYRCENLPDKEVSPAPDTAHVQETKEPHESPATLEMKKREEVPVAPKERRIDRVPRLGMYPQITVYAYPIGIRGFRYTINPPPHVKTSWEKKMTGVEAEQFLKGVKRRHRKSRLETFTLPTEQKK